MKSWHDFHVYEYLVDCQNREVRFKLAWPENGREATVSELIFEDVQGYELINDSMDSIVFEFEEIHLDDFFAEYGSAIIAAYNQNGAYGQWASDLNEAKDTFAKKGVRAVVLNSSFGMVGWLLAGNTIEKSL